MRTGGANAIALSLAFFPRNRALHLPDPNLAAPGDAAAGPTVSRRHMERVTKQPVSSAARAPIAQSSHPKVQARRLFPRARVG